MDVNTPGSSDKVKLDELCKSGGIINAYAAVKLASTLKGERKLTNEFLPKTKMTKSKKG